VPPTRVSLHNVSGPQLYVENVRSLRVKGGSWGPRTDKQPVIVASAPMSYDVTFDGVLFRDALVSNAEAHSECLMALDVQRLVVRNSRFRNCAYFGLMIAHLFGEGVPTDVTLENNVFGQTHQFGGEPAPYSLMIGPIPARNFVIRNNTFESEPAFNNTVFSNSRFVNNIAPVNSCYGGLAYARNVFTTRQRCGPGDRRVPDALRRVSADPVRIHGAGAAR